MRKMHCALLLLFTSCNRPVHLVSMCNQTTFRECTTTAAATPTATAAAAAAAVATTTKILVSSSSALVRSG